jgi:hypothetical protein
VIGHAEGYGSNTGGSGRDRRKFAVAASEASDFVGDAVKKARISEKIGFGAKNNEHILHGLQTGQEEVFRSENHRVDSE